MILDPHGRPINTPVQEIKLRYGVNNSNRDDTWWRGITDSLSASAAHSPEVRRKIREYARAAVQNFPYAAAGVNTLVNDVIGCGPKLNVEADDVSIAFQVETEWRRWWLAAGMTKVLQTARRSRCVDGECFGLLTSNPAIRSPVQLAVRLIETEQVALPWSGLTPDSADGIRFDSFGNATHYHILHHHPGDTDHWGVQEGTWVDAANVLHTFNATRPGQTRGVSEMVSALSLWGDLQRYTSAVISAAELAASLSVLMHTPTQHPDGMTFYAPGEAVGFERGSITTVPSGYEVSQLKAEQPTTVYRDFRDCIISESGRALNQGRGKASGDFSGFNYSSAKMETQELERFLEVDRHYTEVDFLTPVYEAWITEAIAVGLVSAEAADLPVSYKWPGQGHQDPQKDATAQAARLASNTTTLAREYAKMGLDWETELRQRAKEKALLKELGLTESEVMPTEAKEDDDE